MKTLSVFEVFLRDCNEKRKVKHVDKQMNVGALNKRKHDGHLRQMSVPRVVFSASVS